MYAYVTIATNYIYIIGAIRLYQRLKYLKSQYKCIIIITDNIPKKEIQLFKKFNIPYIIKPYINFKNKDGYYPDTINKFHIFSLTEYEKLCYLDADSLPKNNIDTIFNYSIEKNFVFFTDDNEPNCIKTYTPTGSIFLCKPNYELYTFFFNNQKIREKYQNDEQILNTFFYSNIIIGKIQSIYNIYHFAGGPLKLWSLIDKIPILKKIFIELNEKDFNIFIDNYIEKLKYSHNCLIELQNELQLLKNEL